MIEPSQCTVKHIRGHALAGMEAEAVKEESDQDPEFETFDELFVSECLDEHSSHANLMSNVLNTKSPKI
jgi:hypothetical protein